MSAYLDLLMFAVACLVLLMGFPVAFTLAGVALAFGLIGQALICSIWASSTPCRNAFSAR